MKQDKIFAATRRASEASMEFTHSVVEQSKKLRTPSPKAAKIGTAIGCCVGGGLLLTGGIQLLIGTPLWAFGSLAAGTVTVISNLLCRYRSKNRKKVL